MPNSSCHFGKHKSVFLQFLHQSLVPKNITCLYVFSSNIIYFLQNEPLKVFSLKMFDAFECSDQNLSNPHANFEITSQFPFKFCIITRCHDTKLSVNFKLIHSQLWVKGSHQSPNFEIFRELLLKLAMYL